MRPLPCIALLWSVAASGGPAQAPATATRPPCFRGRPLPHCESFMITEFHYGKPAFGSRSGDAYVSGELGGMVNTGPRTAWGGAVVKSFGAERSYLGVRPRYRRWLTDETSLDLSLGILLSGDHERFAPKFPSFTAHAALTQSDMVGVTLGAEVIRGGPGGAEVGWYGGLRFGSYAAPVAGAFFLLIAFMAVTGT